MKKLKARKPSALKAIKKSELSTIKGGMNKSQLIDTISSGG